MMKNIFLVLLIFAATALKAEEPRAIPNRVLFVMETSSDMKRASATARDVLRDLIESGAQQQLKTGDTFGFWTFNEKLNVDYPMQRWDSAQSQTLTSSVTGFLAKVRFEKKGRLAAVLPALLSVVENSKAITVILISAGNDPIHGTPFDADINTAYANYARQLRDAKVPFVTSLVGRNGKIVAYAVNSSLSIQIPKIAPPSQPPKAKLFPETNVVSAATNSVAPPKRYAKQNIIITKSSATNSSPATNAEPKSLVASTNPISTAISSNAIPANNSPTTKIQETVPPVLTNQDLKRILSNVEKNSAPPATNAAAETNMIAVTNIVTVTNVVERTNSIPAKENKIPLPVPATATQPASRKKNFLMIGVCLILVAFALIIFVIGQSRQKSKPSLISRSMDQRK